MEKFEAELLAKKNIEEEKLWFIACKNYPLLWRYSFLIAFGLGGCVTSFIEIPDSYLWVITAMVLGGFTWWQAELANKRIDAIIEIMKNRRFQ